MLSCPWTIISLVGDSAHADSPFSKLEVRQAVSAAIDNKAISDALGYGYTQPAYQHAYSTSYMYDPSITGIKFDPAKAKQLLATAGYPTGFKTTIWYTMGMGYDSYFTSVQKYLSDVGIQAELQPVTSARIYELGTKGWQNGLLLYNPYMATGYPPAKTITYYLSKGAALNVSVMHPDDIETALANSLSVTEQADITKYTQEMNKLITDKYCLVNYLYYLPVLGAQYPSVQGANIWNPWREIWHPENAWLKK
jgi:ABC-type transport system substrate-binding protein